MANIHRHKYEEQHSSQFAVDTGQVIEVGDACFLNTDDVRPASQFTWVSEAKTQQDFADAFVGIAMDASPSGKTTEVRIAMGGVFEMTITSATFEIGDLVTPEKASGSTLEDQIVQTTTDKGAAIGRIVYAGDSQTTVFVEIATNLRGRYPASLDNTVGATKFVFTPLAQVRHEDGGYILTSGTTGPIISQNSGVNQIITWAAGGGFNRIPISWSFQIPHDYDEVQDVLKINAIVLDTAGTDTITMALEVFRITKNPGGTLDWTADLGPTAATVTKSTAEPQRSQWDLDGNSFVAGDTVACIMTPSAHTTDALVLHSIYAEYEQR